VGKQNVPFQVCHNISFQFQLEPSDTFSDSVLYVFSSQTIDLELRLGN